MRTAGVCARPTVVPWAEETMARLPARCSLARGTAEEAGLTRLRDAYRRFKRIRWYQNLARLMTGFNGPRGLRRDTLVALVSRQSRQPTTHGLGAASR